MSASNLSHFDELVSRYLDDTLTDADTAELVALLVEPALAARFLHMTRLNSEFACLLAAPVPDAAMVELVRTDIQKHLDSQPAVGEPLLHLVERARHSEGEPRPVLPRRKPAFTALAWAAAFLVLAALAGVYFFEKRWSAAKMDVATVEGEVYFTDSSGQSRLTGKGPLNKAGQLKTVGHDSRATLVLNDGTRIDVGGNTLLATHSGKDKSRFYLQDGSLDSRILKQPRNRPLIFATPEVEAVVKGTALTLTRWRHHTRLVVTEGQVLLKRRTDGAEIMVRAGFHVLVGPNTKLTVDPNDPAQRGH